MATRREKSRLGTAVHQPGVGQPARIICHADPAAGAALVFGRGDRRTLLLAFVGVLVATLVNPRGFGAWTYVFNSLTVQSSQQFSAEWLPPVNAGWQMNIFFLWLLVLSVAGIALPGKT